MTKEAWFQSVSNYDFTAYMELKSLCEYVHARHVLSESSEQQLLRTDRCDCSIYALDKARELVLHTKPESSTVKKLISAEWNYAYKLSRIRARDYGRDDSGRVGREKLELYLQQQYLRRYLALTNTNDIESRMNRVFLDMIYVVAGIQQSLESELTLMPRINRHILNSLGLLAFDFGKIVSSIRLVSQSLVMSKQRQWDYSQHFIEYWDDIAGLTRKTIRLTRSFLCHSDKESEECQTIVADLGKAGDQLILLEFQGAHWNLCFHFPEMLSVKEA